jgi:putative exosortase-associated protein (TIGR04073 family)
MASLPTALTRLARGLALAALLSLVSAGGAQAQEMTATRKAGRGLAGLTLAGNMAQEWRNDGPLQGLTVGLAMGIVKVPARTVLGAYELLTSPFALPAGYEPLLAPEYSWQYFQAEPGEVYGFSDRYLSAEMAAIRAIPGAQVERSGGALVVRFPGDLLFSTGSATLTRDAQERLTRVADALQRNPGTAVQVQGFTDATGSDSRNLTLSAERADAVTRHLIRQGVDPARLDAAGFGASRAIASNDSAEGRARNRRVELQIRAGGVSAVR